MESAEDNFVGTLEGTLQRLAVYEQRMPKNAYCVSQEQSPCNNGDKSVLFLRRKEDCSQRDLLTAVPEKGKKRLARSNPSIVGEGLLRSR